MNKDKLIDRGYKIFPTDASNPYANCLFQKEVCDNEGIKYYINAYEYSSYEDNKFWYDIEVSFHYYNRIESLKIWDIDMLHIKIEDIEKEIEDKWIKTDCGYYKLYD